MRVQELEDVDRELLAEIVERYLMMEAHYPGWEQFGFRTVRPSAYEELVAAGLVELAVEIGVVLDGEHELREPPDDVGHVRPTPRGVAYAKRWLERERKRERERGAAGA
jgi:hypothetical protein